jgi:hypothetical protein
MINSVKNAYCLSPSCLNADGKSELNYSGALKNVSIGTIECPDCKYILVWKNKKGSIRHYGTSGKEKKNVKYKKTYMDEI